MNTYEVKSWTKCSTCRFVVSSFLCVTSSLRSVVLSPRCQRFFASICHLTRRFVFAYLTALAWEREKVEFSLGSSLLSRLQNSRFFLKITHNITNLSRDEELKTYLRKSVQLIFNRVNEQFDESEREVSYLVILLKTESLDNAILAF